jgi:hypothetical protein
VTRDLATKTGLMLGQQSGDSSQGLPEDWSVALLDRSVATSEDWSSGRWRRRRTVGPPAGGAVGGLVGTAVGGDWSVAMLGTAQAATSRISVGEQLVGR